MSLSAAGLYIVVVTASFIAAGGAMRLRQPRWHRRTWVVIALIFAVFAVMRVVGLEDILRDALRAMLRIEDVYGNRRALQRPLAVAAIITLSVITGFVYFRQYFAVKSRRNIALLSATVSALLMALLMALRIISLHQIDTVLYGPLKLNRVLDIGASLIVLGSALSYLRSLRRRPQGAVRSGRR